MHGPGGYSTTVFSDVLESTRGIGAGAAPATFELVCYVIDDIRELQAKCAKMEEVEVVVSLHVDDLTITVKGTSKILVTYVVVIGVQNSWDRFTKKLGRPFAVKKMFVVASHDDIARKVAKQLKAPSEVVQHEVRRLGVDYSLNVDKKRKLTVAKIRASRHKARWTLLRSFLKKWTGDHLFFRQGCCRAPCMVRTATDRKTSF